MDGTPPRGFLFFAVFRNDFTFGGKPLIFSLLEACDVTNNGRHLGHYLRFSKELEIRLKPREVVIFCALHEKQHINKSCA